MRATSNQFTGRFVALVPAAGVGSRFGSTIPKQYTELAGQAVLLHTLHTLLACSHLAQVCVVLSPDDGYFDDLALPDWAQTERLHVLRCGGETRAASVKNGIDALRCAQKLHDEDWILVHDAARCCLPQSALQRLLAAAEDSECAGAILALPLADTLKRQDEGGKRIACTVSRQGLWQAQTPQMFRAAALQDALAHADLNAITDEASAMEGVGVAAHLIEGDVRNLKLTLAQDRVLAELLLMHGEQNAAIDHHF